MARLSRMIAVVLAASVLPLAAAKCSPGLPGTGRNDLPRKSQLDWLNDTPLRDYIMIGGPRPGLGWAQIGWTLSGRPVWAVRRGEHN